MAVAPVASGTSTTTFLGETSKTITRPAGATSGTLMVLEFGGNSGPNFTLTGSWTPLGNPVVGAQSFTRTWVRIATGSEPASYTIGTSPAATIFGSATISTYSGADATGPVSRISPGQVNATSTTIAWESLTVPNTGGYLLLAGGTFAGPTSGTPSGFTIRSGTTRGLLFDKSVGTGASGTTSSTLASATESSTQVLHVAQTLVAPTNLIAPTVSGNNWSGQVLTVTNASGGWLGVMGLSTPFTYQWKRDGSNISGATSSTYTLTNTDIGHTITCTVTATNTAGATPVTTSGVLVQFQNTAKPTITGTAGAGNTLTAGAGTYVETVSARTYHWLLDGVDVATGTTFNQPEHAGSRRITVREDVTGPLGSGTATSTDTRIFYALRPPFNTTGNPWLQALPSDVSIDSGMSATLQGYLTSSYSGGKIWFGEGGPYGNSFSVYVNIVDSTMPRTAFDLAPDSGFGDTPVTPVKNGGEDPHLAWCLGVKNGGIPTPPGGFKVALGTDAHLFVYSTDTKEAWMTWVTDLDSYDNPRAWAGGYIPDVTQFQGYFQDLTVAPGTTDERQYAGWGEQACNSPMYEGLMSMRDVAIDSSIEHMIGLLLPGTNHTARFPSTDAEASGSGSMPMGGIWQIDPALDPASLPSLGNATLNTFRTKLITALQTYGASVVDTTNANFALRFEGITNVADSWTWGNLFVPSLDQMMKSIPTSSWRMVSASYRPAGGPTLPAPTPVSALHLRPGDFSLFFSTIDATNRLTITAGGSAFPPQLAYSLDESATYVQLVRAGTTACQYAVSGGSGNALSFIVDTTAGTIVAHVTNAGATVGTDTTATYSTTNHSWLRIREAGGTLYFETAADTGTGIPGSWTTFRSLATPGTFWDITIARPVFSLGTGTAIFRNLNEIPAPVATSPGWVVGVA